MPVPVTPSSRRRSRSISNIPRGRNRFASISLQAKVSGYIAVAARGRTAPTSRRAICSTRSTTRLSGGARSGEGAGAARLRRARLCAFEFRSRRRTGQERLPRQGHLRSARQHARQSEAARRDGSGGDPRRRDQSWLYGNSRPIRRPARPQPGARRHAGRRRRRPLNTLVQLDPIYVTFNPSETELAEIQKARACRQGRGRSSRARR